MKEAVYKFFAAVLTVLIFFGILHSMSILSDLNDYNYAKREAEKNSGLAAAGYEIPAVSANAPAEAMRTEPAPITAEDVSYIYIDGIKFEFPCTLADIQAHFDTRKFIENYDEESSEYVGAYILVKNDVGSCRIDFTANSESPLPEECTVKMICDIGFSEKYSPQIIVAGMDIFRISEEEFYYLAALDVKEYLTSNVITYEHENGGYVSLNFISNGFYINTINYCEKDNPEDMGTAEHLSPILTKTELRLPEDYNAETVSEDKEELRDFALEYFTSNNETYTFYVNSYRETAKTTVNDLYSTAYEFLADDSDEYNALYYELTEIESLTKYDINDQRIDTGYLMVTSDCYIEGYEEPVRTDMILKAGDRLGDALIIRIDL